MKSLVFGCTGQTGSYLVEELLARYPLMRVVGVRRRVSTDNIWRLAGPLNNERFTLVEGDIMDSGFIFSLLSKERPDYIYNLAAQSQVWTSFDQPKYTWDVTAQAHLNILEAVRLLTSENYSPRVYNAASSEMFGKSYSIKRYFPEQVSTQKYQDENTPMTPQSPYAIAKLAAYHATRLYREAYNMWAVSGILYNHESPRRGEHFVTRKITKYVADLSVNGFSKKLELGNISSMRDWGYAKEYAGGIIDILMSDAKKDMILATGETHTIFDFLVECFNYVGMDYFSFVDTGVSQFVRPAEVDYLCGDAGLARRTINWEPRVKFKELVKIMMDEELKNVSNN